MMTGLLYAKYGYLKVVLPPELPEELYAFFVPNLVKPPMVSDSYKQTKE